MDGLYVYEIEIRGRLDEKVLNAVGPLQCSIVRRDTDSTAVSARTDQSGLIGLLRHLHGRGVVLLSIRCRDPLSPSSPQIHGQDSNK